MNEEAIVRLNHPRYETLRALEGVLVQTSPVLSHKKKRAYASVCAHAVHAALWELFTWATPAAAGQD